MTIQQYASNVIAFSSQYGATSWSAQQALGIPNTFNYGDLVTAWAPRSRNADGDFTADEFITVGFQTPVFADRIEIRETYGNGFVRSVDLLDINGIYHTIWAGQDPSQPGTPVNFTINFNPTSYLVVGARINVDIDHNSNTWEEIDSIQLTGLEQIDRAGSTLDTARNLGTLGNATAFDFVGADDRNDYYRFSLTNLSNLSLSITELNADADVQIFNDQGTLIAGSYNANSQSELLSLTNLVAGDYYVRVYQYSGNTLYTLNLNAAPIDNAGNTLSTARNLGRLGFETEIYFDWVGSADPDDFYRFTLTNSRDLALRLDNLSTDADLQLIRDANNNGIVDFGEVLASSVLSSSATDSINRTLDAGTYFVRVYQAVGDTNYRLTLAAIPPDLAGNTPSTARNLGVLTSNSQIFSDFVGDPDPSDYYRFTLNSASNFNLQLSDLLRSGEISADADVQLLRLNGDGSTTLINTSDNSGNASESMNLTNLAAGTYLVWVYQFLGDTTYTLRLSATPFIPPDNAGNTLSTARDVGILSNSGRSYSDWVGNLDNNDYYRFSLSSISTLNLVLNGLSADADLELIQDTNNNGIVDSGDVIASSRLGGVQADTISFNNLAIGSYFVRVYNFASNETSYTLSLNAVSNTTGDWFDQNLRDTGLILLTRSRAADGQLSRNDMIAVFRNAQDGGLIDVTEQADLRTIVQNYGRFNMLDYVRYLSQQVANSIFVNMSAGAEEALIGQHFLGTVTPQNSFTNTTTTLTFQHIAVAGSLFGSSGRASIDDIDQGNIGNCAFLAALGAIASSRPDIISNMLIDNGDNTYTVRFYSSSGGGSFSSTNPGTAEYVTVDRRLAVRADGQLLFAAARTRTPNDSTNILWAALIERAYAQWREFREGSNGYNLIGNGDLPQRPLTYISGRSANDRRTTDVSFTQIQTALANSQPITAWTYSASTFLVGSHAYSVVSAYISRGEQRIILRNPWGIDGQNGQARSGEDDGLIDLSFIDFRNVVPRINFVA